jgi:curved DNA-binding protein CbpA
MLQDHYAILEINQHATIPEIKLAYHALAKKFHPDIVGDDPSKIAYFNEIKLAYETLTNPQLKQNYLEKRWYYKSQGMELKKVNPISVGSIIKDVITLQKEAHFMAEGKNNEAVIAEKLSTILTDQNIKLIEDINDNEANEILINQLHKLIPYLPISYYPTLLLKINSLPLSIKSANFQNIQLSIANKKNMEALEKYKWVVIPLLLIILLLLVKYIAK